MSNDDQYIRKVRPVTARQVTEENLSELAGWCGGLVVPAPGLAGENYTEPYIHVPVNNPRNKDDSQAFPGKWIVRENYHYFRVIGDKQFNNGYEPVAKKKPAAPKPSSMPQKKTEGSDPSGLTEPTPAPAQVGAVAVNPSDPQYTPAGPSPVPTQKENNVQDENSFNHDELSGTDNAEAPVVDDVVPGDMNDLEQSETDEDGTVQLGVPVEAPELCGQCGSQVVDGVCSNDIDHDVNGTAVSTDEEPDALPGE